MEKITKEKLNIVQLANNNACFDLQFRKDTRHERTNSPTYYRWKIQFVITGPKESMPIMEKIKSSLDCGNVHSAKNQARFSVQKIDEIVDVIVPYFKKNPLSGKKKQDFSLWQRAAEIIYKNKGTSLTKWKKNELLSLIEIHKSAVKYKHNPRKQKWIDMARLSAKNLSVS